MFFANMSVKSLILIIMVGIVCESAHADMVFFDKMYGEKTSGVATKFPISNGENFSFF